VSLVLMTYPFETWSAARVRAQVQRF
jgi:hypothetical protein